MLFRSDSSRILDKFLRKVIKFNGKELNLEIADTSDKRAMGLQYRDSLDNDCGMLFIFDEPQDVSMHMRNVKFPIDMFFLDKKWNIIKRYTAQPEEQNINCPKVKYVIEVPVETFKKDASIKETFDLMKDSF